MEFMCPMCGHYITVGPMTVVCVNDLTVYVPTSDGRVVGVDFHSRVVVVEVSRKAVN